MHTVNAVSVQLVELDEQMLAAVVGGGLIPKWLKDLGEAALDELVNCLVKNGDSIIDGLKEGYAAAT